MEQQKEYIINNKLYSTADALLLYSCERTKTFGKLSVYCTYKKAFFSVEESLLGELSVKLITDSEVKALMEANPAGIVSKNYIKIFGNVEKG